MPASPDDMSVDIDGPDLLALFAAFVAGFAASGEGWNGEYPFGDRGTDIADDSQVRAAFLRWARGDQA